MSTILYTNKNLSLSYKIHMLSKKYAFNLVTAIDFVELTIKCVEIKPQVVFCDCDTIMFSESAVKLLFEKNELKDIKFVFVGSKVNLEKYSNIGIANISICETDFIDERVDELQREINFEKLLEKEFGDTGTIEFEISNLLSSLGLSPKHSGYAYLRHCILNIVLNNGIISSLNTEQYPIVASTFKTNTTNVERNIRNAILQAWERYGKEN